MPVWLQIILGVCAPLIAYQQWKLNKHKLKLDLFDRRWKIYAAANDLLAMLINGSEDDRRECAKEFRRRLMDARFLCSSATIVFLERVDSRIKFVVDAERALRKITHDGTDRRDAEALVAKEIEGCRSDLKFLLSVFRKELRINF